jgi:multiple sugar transport system ATP-binding protein
LLRLIAGLEDVTSGTIELDGRDITEVTPAKRDLAMVFQTYALYPHMTVRKNLSFALDLAGEKKPDVERKVAEAARILELGALLERQRVAIGRAIVRNPKIFLFDEPLSNLDAALRVQTRLELARLHKELQATMIYVTHDQVEAMTLATKVVVLSAGRIEQIGSPLELYYHPANLFVAGFLGTPKMGFLGATVQAVQASGIEVRFASGAILVIPRDGSALSVGQSVTIGIRPEHLTLGTEGQVPVVTDVTERLGSDTFCHVNVDSGESLTVRVQGDCEVPYGAKRYLTLDVAHCHLFDENGISVGPAALRAA